MQKIHLYDKILSPVVTEKSTNLSEHNKRIPILINQSGSIPFSANLII